MDFAAIRNPMARNWFASTKVRSSTRSRYPIYFPAWARPSLPEKSLILNLRMSAAMSQPLGQIMRTYQTRMIRAAFQADYRYYREHGMFDFPQADLRTRLMNMVLTPLVRIPSFRKRMFADLKKYMVQPFEPVLRDA